MNVPQEQRAALRLDIFRTTGLKVDEDDPIMLCALLQAKLMRDAATDAALHLEQSVSASLQAVEQVLQRRAELLAETIAKEARSSIEKQADSEGSKIAARLAKAARAVQAKLPCPPPEDEAVDATWGKRAVLIVGTAILISSLLASKFVSNLSVSEQQHLKFGQQVARALPQMDERTRKALFDAIHSTEKIDNYAP